MTIGALVERERRHLRLAEICAGLLLALGAGALVLGIAAMSLAGARWLTLPRALPLLVWAVVALLLGAFAALTRWRLMRRGSRHDIALAIEREQGLRRGVLVGVLELEGQGGLAARAAESARARLPHATPLAPSLRRSSARRTTVAMGLGLVGVLTLATTSPLFGDGLRAVMRPIDAWRGTLLAPITIVNAPRELVRGARLALGIVAPGRSRLFVSHRQTGEAWRTDTVATSGGSVPTQWSMAALHGDVRVVVTEGRRSSDSVLVRAVDRPYVGAVILRVEYPAYLSRAAETLPVGEPMHLPRGTVLTISGRASVPLTTVTLRGAAGERYALTTSGQTFAGRLVVDRSAALHWTADGSGGAVTDVPPPLDLDVVADSAPHVTILAPAGDTLLANGDESTLSVTASDDHGIASIVLRAAHGTSGAAEWSTQPIAGQAGTSWSGDAPLDIGAMRLAPGEIGRVRIEAIDSSPWAQRGVSRELIVKRPSMEEQRTAARALGDAAVKEARAAASAQRSLAQRTDEAARAQTRSAMSKADASTTPASPRAASMNFESAEKSRSLAQEQRAMADRVQKLREATQQLERQLKAAGALDTSLARQLGEAQALMRQALTPRMMAQMQKLESAAQQLNGEQSRDALRDLTQMQQRMREQLEKSAEMLKRAAHEGAMQTLADQAKELAQRERAVAESAAVAQPVDRAPARESAKLAEQSKRLREQMEDLKDRLTKDKAEAGASRTEQAGEHAAKSEASMRRAASAGQQGQQGEQARQETPAASRQARDAAKEMDDASKSMQDARAAQVKDWKRELTSELDQSVQEMMQLAREERALEQQARNGAATPDQRGAQSAVEQGVDKANERLQRAAKKSALLSARSQRAMSDARDKVAQATQKVTASQNADAARQQASALGDASEALTRAAAALARDRERANSAGSASGFSEMLEEMQKAARSQGQINGQAQSLMSMPGGATGSQGQSLARALARQQRGVADQLEDAGDGAGGDHAAQLAREARQLADQLDGGRLDAGTLARQQQLFRRLLDAGHSLEKEEREDSGKREATSATGTNGFVPGARVDGKAAARFRAPTWEELRGLSADERRAILDYFTRLNNGPASGAPR
jgi:hypothetical protein